MNWLDVIVLILWGIMIAWGISTGITTILLNLLAVAAAMVAGSRLGPKVGELLVPSNDLGGVQAFVGFILVFVAVFAAFVVAANLFKRVLGFLPFSGWFDRLGGAALGLLVGILLSLGVLVGLKQLEHDAIDESISAAPFAGFVVDNFGFVVRAARLVPEDWKVELEDRIGKVTDPWDRLI